MQEVISEIELAKRRIESSYGDLRNFASELCHLVLRLGTGTNIVIAPGLKNAVKSALDEKNKAEEELKQYKSDAALLSHSKEKVQTLKERVKSKQKSILVLKRRLGAVAFERAQAIECDKELKEALSRWVDRYVNLSKDTKNKNPFISFKAKVSLRIINKKLDREFINIFDTLEEKKLLRSIKSERTEPLLNEYQRLSKKNEELKKQIHRGLNEIENRLESVNKSEEQELEEIFNDKSSLYNEACINYGLFLFDNGSKWLNEKCDSAILDVITLMLQTRRYIDAQEENIKRLNAIIRRDDYIAIIKENEKKIDTLKKEIERINTKINELTRENESLLYKVKKLGSLDE